MGSEVADVTQVLSNTSLKVFFSTKTGEGGSYPPPCPPTQPLMSVDELFQSLSWHTLEHQRKVDFSFLMYKDLNYETPEYLSLEFITGMDVTPYTYVSKKYGKQTVRTASLY